MNLIDYLKKYSQTSFKKVAFNEIDALALADFSYVDFTELGVSKERIKAADLLVFLDNYVAKPTDSERKLNYLKVARLLCKSERFEKVYSQGSLTVTEIWVDKETGVNYIFHASGYSGGMTVLLDKDGKPVITPNEDK